jgi:hypothetical protein
MRPVTRFAILVPAVLALCAGCQQQQQVNTDKPAAKADTTQVVDQSNLPLSGTLSCSGRGCHASLDQSNADKKPLPCAFSLWSDNDPHTGAWDALWRTERGQNMSKLLYAGADGKKGEPTAAWNDPRCLACHVTPQAAKIDAGNLTSPQDSRVPEEWRFGVGCEGCHGRANKWLGPHYREKWTTKQRSEAEKKELAARKKELGYNDLSDLRERALVCAGCHVGAPANDDQKLPLRDMNHDHVAAGHPRLMFEFAAFLANEPKHWKEKDTSQEFAGRAWVAGQYAAAEAALRLTADRAKAAGKDEKARPWPELTEYDCYACHQTLGVHSWRVKLPIDNRPGRFRPSRWYTGLLEPLGAFPQGSPLPALESELRKHYPPPAKVAEQATAIAKALQGKPGNVSQADLAKYRQALIERGKKLDTLTWDECEQIALGLLALDRARGDREAKEAKAVLKLLAFPKGYDSRPGFREINRDDKGEKSMPFDKQWTELFGKLQ